MGGEHLVQRTRGVQRNRHEHGRPLHSQRIGAQPLAALPVAVLVGQVVGITWSNTSNRREVKNSPVRYGIRAAR